MRFLPANWQALNYQWFADVSLRSLQFRRQTEFLRQTEPGNWPQSTENTELASLPGASGGTGKLPCFVSLPPRPYPYKGRAANWQTANWRKRRVDGGDYGGKADKSRLGGARSIERRCSRQPARTAGGEAAADSGKERGGGDAPRNRRAGARPRAARRTNYRNPEGA